MRLGLITTLLSLGAGSLAVLIPPSTALENGHYRRLTGKKVDTHGMSPEAYAISQLTQTVEIPCESCPFAKNLKTESFAADPNNLELTLSLDPNARDVIFLNGAPLFPLIYSLKSPVPFTVTQTSLASGEKVQVPVNLDLFLETDENNLSRLRLHVLSVSGFKTQATMRILDFPVFQNNDGEVFIGEVHAREPTMAEASAVMCKDNILCRWKAYLYDYIHKFTYLSRKGKGCRGKKYKHPSHAVGHEQPHHGQHMGDQGKHHSQGQEPQQLPQDIKPKWRPLNWVDVVMDFILFGITFIFLNLVIYAWASKRIARLRAADEEGQGLMGKEEEAQLEITTLYSDDLPVYAETQEKH